MFDELDLKEIKASGWLYNYLKTQSNGLTGNLGKIGEPFSFLTWEQKHRIGGDDNFLGGINSKDDGWVPFEQNGYWIDGMIRCGRLINDEKLIKLASSKIYPAIEKADSDGFIGPSFMKTGISWQHAVYFRSLMAEYSATKDEKILEALKKHFLRCPLKDIYKNVDWRIITVRNVVDIEVVLWLYKQTKDERFLQMAKESYDEFNRLYYDDSKADITCKMKDLTVKGMLSNGVVNKNHGVTYNEVCKTAAIMYKYTKKEEYKKAAINAFDKLYRDQMLIDGVHSSSEYLNGNSNSHAMHETCDVSDFTWALGYLYMINPDTKYADWIENAVFNAGLGSVDDDFKGHQYFSCPNQVICDDHSNHGKFFRGGDWISYAPKKFLPCCTGNVNRFMPNYVARCFMRDGDSISAFLYGPCEINTTICGKKLQIVEDTKYPFENRIRFIIKTENDIRFKFILRKPNWATSIKVLFNHKEIKVAMHNNSFVLERDFFDGDEIELIFTDKIELIYNAKGVSVKKGPLLYALPVKENVVIEGLRELNNPDFPHYSLYPLSKWNYGLVEGLKSDFYFSNGNVLNDPWRRSDNDLAIYVKLRQISDWRLLHKKYVYSRMKPRGPLNKEEREATFIPSIPKVHSDKLGNIEDVKLVPYCTTRLRIAIFPIIK